MSFQRPKGTNDILPGESEKWQFVEETARLLFRDYQYNEMRTPIFEHYEVISRSVGDTTDIVSKSFIVRTMIRHLYQTVTSRK